MLSVVLSGLVAFGLAHTGVLTSLDNILENQRLEWNNRAPSGDVILVEIDSTSLRDLDRWPWPRTIYADLLDTLMEMGADEVAFDVDFSSRSTEADDAAFQAALQRAGGYAYLAAFEQISGITGELERADPLARFSRYADPVIVNVILDRWGLARAVPLQAVSGNPPTPAIALQLGRPMTTFPSTALIDFSIDLNAIDRMPVADVLNGKIAAARIAGKRVVVGASAIELRDLFSTPRFGIIPGPLVQIAATETIAADRVLHPVSTETLIGIFAGIGLLSLLVLATYGIAAATVTALVAGVLLELAAALLFGTYATLINTAVIHTAIVVFLVLIGTEQAYIWLTQRQAMQARLQHLARFDEVTGARTRYGFIEKLQADIVTENPMLVLVVEIHRLEAIRGALGYAIADATLREIAERLGKIVPDYVARVGDKRFAVALRSRDTAHGVDQLSEQISFALNEPFSVEERLVHIDIAMAGASVAEAGESASSLLTCAELSLGQVSTGGETGATLFDPAFAEALSRRRQLDLDMRAALRENQFRLAMQPQVKLRTGKLVGVEALIRWQHPDLGYIPPPELIGLAEETGFIVDLGAWVLVEACRLSASWSWHGRVAVNVSPLQISMADMPGTVRSALASSGLAASQLEIEVTETVAAGEGSSVGQVLQNIRDLGVTVAIDDFGTGFSSLSYLNKLPFDMLKIDRSFVTNVHADMDRRAIVEAIIAMGKKLGKTILVEGVETAAEHDLMCALGCDVGQGYFYGKPVDANKLSAHLARKGTG